MIILQSDCLVFEMSTGESVPCSAESVAIEIIGDAVHELDSELIHNVSAAVLHYFKVEQQRVSVSIPEFTAVLEKVLRGLGFDVVPNEMDLSQGQAAVSQPTDLCAIASESGKGFELAFFEKLRKTTIEQLESSPDQIQFSGLRGCVKQLLGARRWSSRCEAMSDQIVAFIRSCFASYANDSSCALVVV